MLFRYRNLPHLEIQSGTYFVTFRIAGSVPRNVIESWRFEREDVQRNAICNKRPLSDHENKRLKYLYSEKIERYMDQGYGDCWLRNPQITQLVIDALRYFDGERYNLHAWCVMPNHVHVVFTAVSTGNELVSDLSKILHSWKSFTSHGANRILGRSGQFWQGESYDHLIRGDEDFWHCIDYTLENPVKAGLCKYWYGWPGTGCSQRIKELLEN